MEPLHLYNSKSRTLEQLTPVSGTNLVTIYNCGPTVYKRQHIGNMRRFLVADTLNRTLELFGYAVNDVTNITDVGHLTQDEIDAGEDKLEKAAKETKRTPQQIAAEQTELFFQDIDELNIQRSQQYPRASDNIDAMIALIEKLIANGHAYITESGVYYDVTTFPAYGELSGNTVAALDAGHRIETRKEKKHPADFALWMIDSTHLQLWDSPWGKGYPGWHIECSAMGMKELGETIDIHTGGEDNRFPHHENEIAQSEGATGKPFAHIWMHNRHLLLGGKKMAKREGESITLSTIKEHNYTPLAFRLLVFAHHYRSPIDFSWELLDEYQKHIEGIHALLVRLSPLPNWGEGGGEGSPTKPPLLEAFHAALADDLNTPKAFAVFLETIKEIHKALDANSNGNTAAPYIAALIEMDRVIGILSSLKTVRSSVIPQEIINLSEKREAAKKEKDYAAADALRSSIEQQGYEIQDTPQGPLIHPKRLS